MSGWRQWQRLLACAALAAAGSIQASETDMLEFSNPWKTPDVPPTGGSAVEWGPVYSRFQASDGSMRERALGPLFERVRLADGSAAVAVRPLYARETNAVNGRVNGEILWPAIEFSALGRESGWRALVAWYRCFNTEAELPRWRLWVLPFYFQGRNAAGETYAAVFPLGGRISEMFGQDDIRFALFPLWVSSSVGDLETLDLLFPFYSLTRGRTTERFRLFPLYGRSEQFGNYTKRFILWPFWTQAEYTYPTSAGKGFILFPLYGRIDLTDQTSWLVLPPFIRISRGSEVERVYAPWPFVQIERGRQSRFHLWPLFGRTTDPAIDRAYIAWPFLWSFRLYRDNAVHHSVSVVPVFNMETRRGRGGVADAEGDGPVRSRRWKFWPLASYARDGDDLRFRAPSLWPTRDFAVTERSWSPLWTLVERRATAGAAETEILWGLVRRRSEGGHSARTSVFPLVEWSGREAPGGGREGSVALFKGLAGWSWGEAGRELRLVYGLRIPMGGH